MQFRALAASTAMCGALGALGFGAMYIGLQVQPVAEVSSVADAIALARQQRVGARLSWCHKAPLVEAGVLTPLLIYVIWAYFYDNRGHKYCSMTTL